MTFSILSERKHERCEWIYFIIFFIPTSRGQRGWLVTHFNTQSKSVCQFGGWLCTRIVYFVTQASWRPDAKRAQTLLVMLHVKQSVYWSRGVFSILGQTLIPLWNRFFFSEEKKTIMLVDFSSEKLKSIIRQTRMLFLYNVGRYLILPIAKIFYC